MDDERLKGNEEGTRDDEDNPLQKNQRSSNLYHANWLNMMYPRIKVSNDPLMDDGVIFISIDDKDETFRRLKNLIERNSGLAKKTYTVEFI